MNVNEKYNALMNAKSAEEMWQLRESFLENNNENILDKNLISIRILSNNEYNDFIVSGTCNGSITTNNNNVWHNSINQNYKLSNDPNSANSSDSPGYTSNGITYVGQYGMNDGSYRLYRTSVNGIFELLQNNTNNLFTVLANTSLSVTWFSKTGYSWVYGSFTDSLENKYSINKTSNSVKIKTMNLGYTSGRGSSIEAICYVVSSFRPAFQYVDNNKSINLFS